MSQAAPAAAGDDRGVGWVSSVAGLLVVIMFLTLAVQVMLGLFATSTVRATLNDAASRAANTGEGRPGAELTSIADEAKGSLGRMGDRTEIRLRYLDEDGDGLPDVVVGDVVAVPPRIVPRWLGGMIGFDKIRESVRIRVERFR